MDFQALWNNPWFFWPANIVALIGGIILMMRGIKKGASVRSYIKGGPGKQRPRRRRDLAGPLAGIILAAFALNSMTALPSAMSQYVAPGILPALRLSAALLWLSVSTAALLWLERRASRQPIR